MKKNSRWIPALAAAIVLSVFPAYGAQPNMEQISPIGQESQLLPAGASSSQTTRPQLARRGVFFAAADLTIENKSGEIGVAGHAYLDSDVDELYMSFYLDQWDAAAERWTQAAYYDYEFFGEDYPDGLDYQHIEFTVTNVPQNKYYRMRGSYAAVISNRIESFGLATDGVLID